MDWYSKYTVAGANRKRVTHFSICHAHNRHYPIIHRIINRIVSVVGAAYREMSNSLSIRTSHCILGTPIHRVVGKCMPCFLYSRLQKYCNKFSTSSPLYKGLPIVLSKECWNLVELKWRICCNTFAVYCSPVVP